MNTNLAAMFPRDIRRPCERQDSCLNSIDVFIHHRLKVFIFEKGSRIKGAVQSRLRHGGAYLPDLNALRAAPIGGSLRRKFSQTSYHAVLVRTAPDSHKASRNV